MKKRTIALIAALCLFFVGVVYYQAGSQPVDKNNQGVQAFVINKGDGLSIIAKNLSKAELIRSNVVFYLAVKRLGLDKNIQAGEYQLSKNMSTEQIAQALTHGTQDVWVTVIEGLRKEEIAQVLARSFPIDPNDFIKQAKEGTLFPDTYLIPRDSSSAKLISIMNDNFDKKYDAGLRQKVAALGLSDHQALVLASLVEKEARFPEDKKIVAGILIKRFRDDWMMNLDATIQYAIGYQRKERTWWKKDLSVDDLAVDSTYNTYKYKGLPPGPICDPGLESLQAVANADVNTPYWYYISDKKGVMHYAKTLDQHNANIKAYLQ